MSAEQPDLLDVLSGAADRRDAEAERRKAYETLRATCPDGRVLAEDETWCGRCGETVYPYDLTINHDLGYCGCPVESDPTWKRYPRREDGRGFRGHGAVGYPGEGGTLTVEDLCDRWDRQFFPDCTCGHPWGLHEDHDRCLAWCGCFEYEAVS